MRELLFAALAFAGASVAQLVSHLLAMRRSHDEKRQLAIQFAYVLVAEIDQASKILALILSLQERVEDKDVIYRFSGDPMTIQFEPSLLSKYDHTILITPHTVYRAATFLNQAKSLIDAMRVPPGEVTEAGHRYMFGLLRYGLSLSIRIMSSIRSGSLDDSADISDDQVIDYYRQFRFPGGGTYLKVEDLKALIKKYSEVRF